MKKGTKLVEYDPLILSEAYKDWQFAPYGTKTMKLKQWAKLLGMSPQHLHRVLRDFRKGWEVKKQK